MKTSDPRYLKLRRGLEQLDDDQLRRILSYEETMCCDNYLYDEQTGFY